MIQFTKMSHWQRSVMKMMMKTGVDQSVREFEVDCESLIVKRDGTCDATSISEKSDKV